MKKVLSLTLIILFSSSFLLVGQGIQRSSNKAIKANYQSKAGYLYAQMTASVDGAIASQKFPDFGNCVLQGADDFIVTGPGTGWSINKVDVIGEFNALAPPANCFEVYFYANNAGVPGALVYSGTGLAYTESAGIYSITLASPAVLPAGTYWISVMPQMSFSTYGQWFWKPAAAPLKGSQFEWQDPCTLILPYTTWSPGYGPFPGYSNYDLCFVLYGSPYSTSVPVSNWALYFGIFLMVTFIGFRFIRMR